MADDEIKISLTTEDLTAAGVASAKKNLDGLGMATEKMTVGAKGMGIAVKSVAHQVGITGAASRLFGHEVSDLSMALGVGASALGIVAVAGIAAYKIYDHLTESSKKVHEETLKAGAAAGKWIEQAAGETRQTNELRLAKERLYSVEATGNKIKLDRGIEEQTKNIIDSYEKMQKSTAHMTGDDSGHSGLFMLIYGNSEKRKRAAEDAKMDYEKGIAELQVMYGEKGLNTKQWKGYSKSDWKAISENVDYEAGIKQTQKRLENDAAYQQQALELERASGVEKQTLWQQELTAFDATTTAKLTAMAATTASMDDISNAFSLREMERAAKVADYEIKLAEQVRQAKMNSIKQSVDNFGQAAQLMASMGGEHARKWFSVQKTAAIAEAVINTYQGATKALSQGGVYGAVLMASVLALGAAQIAKIRAQEFDGGAGAISSVPTTSTNWTGLPQSGGNGFGTININVNGERVSSVDVKELTGNVVEQLYKDNGYAAGGYKVNVEQHA